MSIQDVFTHTLLYNSITLYLILARGLYALHMTPNNVVGLEICLLKERQHGHGQDVESQGGLDVSIRRVGSS